MHSPLKTMLALSIAAFFAATPIHAQSQEAASQTIKPGEAKVQEGVFTLGEIEVKDSTEITRNVTVEKVLVEETREFNKNNVAQALDLLPGVYLTQMGGRNEQTISVRGYDAKRVPLFLDGIPIYVPYDGYPDLGRFTTYDVSEIIVSKGFTSVLYGPNTEGGAVNMVSRRPQKEIEIDTGIGYSTGNTYYGYANFGTNQKLWYLQGGASYQSSDHFILSDNYRETTKENGGYRDNSYYKDRKFNFKAGLTPAEGHEYAFSYINQHGEKGNPIYAGTDASISTKYWQWPYWNKESFYFTSRTPFGKDIYVKTRLYYDKYANSLLSYDDATYTTQLKKSSFRSDYDDHTRGGSIEAGTTLIPRNNVKVAIHYKEDYHQEHNKPAPYQHFKDEIFSAGIEDTIQITKDFYTILGISYDQLKTVQAEDTYSSKTKTFGYFAKDDTSAVNPQIGLFYNVTPTGKVYATMADKSRLPGIKDKYSYRFGTALPNATLKPEKATNYELGYQDTFCKRYGVKGSFFYSDVTDMILLVKVPDPNNAGKTVNQNQNIGNVRRYGVELELTALFADSFEGGFNYTFIFADNKTTTDKITDLPRHKVFGYAKYMPVKSLALLADIEYNSDRYSSTDGAEVTGSFAVTNFKATYQIMKGLQVEGGISNIFDRDYAITEGYPMPGRTWFANMRYTF